MQVNLDCEGPITQNDNAFELCEAYIPHGGDFFARISRYDDYLAFVERRQGYKAGDTLKLVLPFLKAYGVTTSVMRDFSLRTLSLLPGTEKMLPFLLSRFAVFIISTSYRPYLDALCRATGFPVENIYCTDVDLDQYHISDEEKRELMGMAAEILDQPLINWPEGARCLDDLPEKYQEIVRRIDMIFRDIIPELHAGKIFDRVNPVGGYEKAVSVNSSLQRTGFNASDVFYVGDSITDIQAMELVRSAGGVALSFNGNSYAVNAATWACLSGNTAIIGALADFMGDAGMMALYDIPLDGNAMAGGEEFIAFLRYRGVREDMLAPFNGLTDDELPRLYLIGETDVPALIMSSEAFRKGVRGVNAGNLG